MGLVSPTTPGPLPSHSSLSSGLLIGWHREHITNADFCLEIARVSGILFDFVTQPVDVHLEHMTFASIFSTPDMLEQQILRDNTCGP